MKKLIIALATISLSILSGPFFCNDTKGGGGIFVQCEEGHHPVKDSEGNINCFPD